MPHPHHESIRRAFDYRCGYCGVDEAAVGAELTVDHYRPRSMGVLLLKSNRQFVSGLLSVLPRH